MKTSILISSLVSITLTAPMASAKEMSLGTDRYSTLISANPHELLSGLPSSQVIVSDFHLAMMDEKEDMDKMDDKDKMKKKGDMHKMHDKDDMHKMHDMDKMKKKNGMGKKGNGEKGATTPSSKKQAPAKNNPPPAEMSDTPAPMPEPAPMTDM